MPERYHVPVAAAPARFRLVGKYGTVDWREDCARCRNCVKNLCVYGVYRAESAYNRDPSQPLQPLFDCHACLSCIQGCTKGLLSLAVNEEYLTLGDEYWRPEIIETTWRQAETGSIPVSGAGYRGPFSGPGFDSMWTDMSEIVRPTRDGIHGREYISTSVDIGSKPMRLSIRPDGTVADNEPLVEVRLPVVLDIPPWHTSENLTRARIAAAAALGTLAIVKADECGLADERQITSLVPLLQEGDDLAAHETVIQRAAMVEIVDGDDVFERAGQAHAASPGVIVCARVLASPAATDRAVSLYKGGVKAVHLCADLHGNETAPQNPRFIKDVLRDLHTCLVQEGVRDEVTLIAGGGIALPEHMAKAIICGADLVAVDLPLLIALGCRACGDDHNGSCPAGISDADPEYAKQRMVNLMGAWHAQLIEVLGAMGIREVRRLRGETGRAMFREDLEREAFGDLGN